MKYLILVTIFILVAADEEWKPIIDNETNVSIFKICTKQSGLTKEKLEQFITQKHLDEKEVHEYVLCHVKKLGLFTEDSGYNPDRVIAYFTALNAITDDDRSLVTKCVSGSDAKSTPAVRAFRDIVCVSGGKFDEIYKKTVLDANNNNEAVVD